MPPAGFAIVTQALTTSQPDTKKIRGWRDEIRLQTKNGAELSSILLDLARGNAWVATLPDGRISAPVLPSSDVRLRAAMFLHEAVHGKAVAQTEVVRAEAESKELDAIRALSDDELEAEATRILEARRVPALTEGAPGPEYTVARESSTADVQLDDLITKIWNSTPETQ